MLSLIFSIIKNTIPFWVSKLYSFLFPVKSTEVEAVSVETKMGQDIADEPSQAEAVKELKDGAA
jgi:hypothetical protein